MTDALVARGRALVESNLRSFRADAQRWHEDAARCGQEGTREGKRHIADSYHRDADALAALLAHCDALARDALTGPAAGASIVGEGTGFTARPL